MQSPVTTRTQWIDTPRGQLFAQRWLPADDTGKPPIILFHDSLGCVALWRDFPEQLCQATGHEVIAYDRLGFGQSDAYPGALPLHFIRDEADYFFARLKAALHIGRFVALGHSVGGAMAATCAARFPQECAALITVSAQAFVEDRTLQGIREAKAQFGEPGQLGRLEKYHGDKARWVLDAWTETWLSPAFADWALEDCLGPIQSPLLAVHGEHDEYGSLLHPQRITRLSTPHGEYLMLPECGHVPHREAPDRLLEVVRQHLHR